MRPVAGCPCQEDQARDATSDPAALKPLLLLRHGLLAAAVVVAALGVVAEMTLLLAAVRVTRRELRGDGGAA